MKKNKLPQRKPNKVLTGKELLDKAIYGTHIKKSENQLKTEEYNKIINKNAK